MIIGMMMNMNGNGQIKKISMYGLLLIAFTLLFSQTVAANTVLNKIDIRDTLYDNFKDIIRYRFKMPSDEDVVDEDVFVKATISKEKAYYGEQLIVSYKIYSVDDISNFYLVEQFTCENFIITELPDYDLDYGYEMIGGKEYEVTEIARLVVTPTTTGTLEIRPFDFEIYSYSFDYFYDTFSSNSLKVEILPLPTKGKPADFSGLVGELTADAYYDNDEIEFGEAITLNLNLTGTVNLNLLQSINLDKSIDFTNYQNEKYYVEEASKNQYSSSKAFEILLMPKTTGELYVEPITINYFNVETEEYDEVVIEGHKVIVTGDIPVDEKSGSAGGSGSKKKQQVVIKQISPNKSDKSYFKIKKSYVFITVAAFVLIIIMIIAVSALKKAKAKKKKDKPLLEIYKKLNKAKNPNECYDVLNEMIKYQYKISLKASTRDKIAETVKNEKLVQHIFSVMDSMEEKNDQQKANLEGLVRKVYNLMK